MKPGIHPDYHPVVFQDGHHREDVPDPLDGDEHPHR